jgi:hypothetical protein
MDSTAEVRWFFRGEPPGPLAGWFASLGAEPQQRTDSYLRLPETDALGVKVRGGGGNLELKLRARDHGIESFEAGVEGKVEKWQKWSFPVEQPVPGLGIGAGNWVDVGKARRIAAYTHHGWEPGPEPRRSGDGCSAELTQLEAAGEAWATLGFEAFGAEATILETLRQAARQFFAEVQLPGGLSAGISLSYPGWVGLVGRDPGPP